MRWGDGRRRRRGRLPGSCRRLRGRSGLWRLRRGPRLSGSCRRLAFPGRGSRLRPCRWWRLSMPRRGLRARPARLHRGRSRLFSGRNRSRRSLSRRGFPPRGLPRDERLVLPAPAASRPPGYRSLSVTLVRQYSSGSVHERWLPVNSRNGYIFYSNSSGAQRGRDQAGISPFTSDMCYFLPYGQDKRHYPRGHGAASRVARNQKATAVDIAPCLHRGGSRLHGNRVGLLRDRKR